mmetsp:Transcript_87359/g.187333  ORF Transcript_87359/g.187333 Transcript_87359/m.187333 type:complete len:216 (+) Transcript_87359:1619-2266(+)
MSSYHSATIRGSRRNAMTNERVFFAKRHEASRTRCANFLASFRTRLAVPELVLAAHRTCWRCSALSLPEAPGGGCCTGATPPVLLLPVGDGDPRLRSAAAPATEAAGNSAADAESPLPATALEAVGPGLLLLLLLVAGRCCCIGCCWGANPANSRRCKPQQGRALGRESEAKKPRCCTAASGAALRVPGAPRGAARSPRRAWRLAASIALCPRTL